MLEVAVVLSVLEWK